MCEKQFLPQGTYTVIGRKNMHAHRKINTQDAKCYELGKGKTSYPIKGFQRTSTGDHLEEWAKLGQDRREQYKQGQQWESTVHVQKTISNLSAT